VKPCLYRNRRLGNTGAMALSGQWFGRNCDPARGRGELYTAPQCCGGFKYLVPVVGHLSVEPCAFDVYFFVLLICNTNILEIKISGTSGTV
jgi:hypothetical protein